MVYIRKVEISGFKSFARKSTILNLDKGLVCITGPNGSGKSNILDAIAFALGENSVRVLRVDRLQSLIHDSNGRSKGERVGDDAGEEDDDGVNDSTTTIVVEARERDRKRRAVRVSITFDNSDRGIPLDSNTVTITREMYGNGENQYYLNGKHVNKSTITNMLDVALATPNKLNIVQQGMVMRIAELNPEERRRIIEEIIGLAYFDEKKEEAMKQLVEADRRLEVALARMGEIRSRIDELEQERNDQLRLEFLAREIERLKRIQIRSMLKHTRERLTTLEDMIGKRREAVEGISKSIDDLRSRITAVEDEKARFMKHVEESSRSKAEISKQLSSMLVRVEQLKATLNANQSRIVTIGKDIPTLIKERSKLVEKVKVVEQDICRLTTTLEEMMDERKKVEEELNYVSSRINMLLKEYSNKREEEKSVEGELKRLLDDISSIELKLALLDERIKISDENMVALQRRSSEIGKEMSNINALILTLSEKRSGYAKELEVLDNAITQAYAKREKLTRQVDGVLTILERAEYIATRYQTEIDLAMQGEDGTIVRLMDNADGFGIIGMLQSLLTWDAKYTRAVMAVGSNWLKTLIVRDVKSMLAVLEHVKRLGLARVTMIPLDMIEGCEEAKSVRLRRLGTKPNSVNNAYSDNNASSDADDDDNNSNANAKDNDEHSTLYPLSHFITSRYRGLVNFIFGDTLLAYSRGDALSLARRGYRVVTMDGELFEPSIKAATLDINSRISDIIRLVARSRSVKELNTALSLLKQVIERKREEVKGLETTIQDMEMKRREITSYITRIDMEMEHAKITLARYEQVIKENNARIERISDEILGMKEQVKGLREGHSTIGERISALKERMNTLAKDKEGLEIAMEEINRAKASLTARFEQLDRERRGLMTSIAAKNSERDGMLRRIDEISKGLEQAKAGARESAVAVKRCRDELNRCIEELKVLRDREQEVIDASSSSLARLHRYDEELRLLMDEEKRLSRQLSMLERELALYSKEYNDLKSKEESLIKELSSSNSNYGDHDEHEREYGYDGSDINNLLEGLEEEYNMLKSNVNQLANRSYMQLIDGYRGMSEKKNQLEEERNAIVRFIEQIEGEKRQLFLDAFSKVDREVRSIFSTMSDDAGAAWLEIDDADGDIFSSGIAFIVQFPNKSARESNSLSGGEKTIAAITFLLALQSLKPAPFYLFDEIDAHLDSVNTDRLKRIVRERANISQIIMVTLKDALVASADMIYGVYARDGVSQVIRYRIPIAR
ncbi:MAG: chromosome segregation SMC family protein [Candidatus Nitrosocaldus sp.]